MSGSMQDKRKVQKERSINLRYNYPIHYTHKERKILRRIKALNGFSKKQMTSFEDITKVEVTLETFKIMYMVEVFYNLQELLLVRCDIKEIGGLKNLKHLEML